MEKLNELMKKYYILSSYNKVCKPYGYIYIYYNPTYGRDTDLYKIGVTINCKTRIVNLNNGQANRGFYCYISEITNNYDLTDLILKKTLEKYSHYNEVYKINIDKAISFIENLVYDVNNLLLDRLNDKYSCLQSTKYYMNYNKQYEIIKVSQAELLKLFPYISYVNSATN
jgi:hypothetical protein